MKIKYQIEKKMNVRKYSILFIQNKNLLDRGNSLIRRRRAVERNHGQVKRSSMIF